MLTWIYCKTQKGKKTGWIPWKGQISSCRLPNYGDSLQLLDTTLHLNFWEHNLIFFSEIKTCEGTIRKYRSPKLGPLHLAISEHLGMRQFWHLIPAMLSKIYFVWPAQLIPIWHRLYTTISSIDCLNSTLLVLANKLNLCNLSGSNQQDQCLPKQNPHSMKTNSSLLL